MLRLMCKSKIHRARITKVDLHYEGSIGIDTKLMRAAGIYPGEIVQVVNVNNGSRFETYTIEEEAESGIVGLYGAAAHLGKVGDLVIVLSYAIVTDRRAKDSKIRCVRVDEKNRLLR